MRRGFTVNIIRDHCVRPGRWKADYLTGPDHHINNFHLRDGFFDSASYKGILILIPNLDFKFLRPC